MRLSGVWWRALLVFAVALVPRLLIIAQPIPLQLNKSLPDDAYYYFLTAQNIVAGNGPAVDGMHPSNGWHPLWMLVTTGVYALPFGDLDTPIRIIAALGSICDSLVAVVLYLGARRFVGEAALFGALLYGINAMPLLQAVNGLETGFAALSVAVAWVLTLAFVEQPMPRRAVLWGASFGVAFLARTDTALILAFLGLYVLVSFLRSRQSLPLIAASAAVALVIVLPWWLWNAANFGSPFDQSSASAVPWAMRARFEMNFPGQPLWQLALRNASIQFWLRGDHLGAPVIAGYIMWPLALLGVWWSRREGTQRLALVTVLLLLGGLALFFVHTFLRFYPRPWYFYVMAQSLSLGLSLFFFHAGKVARLAGAAVSVAVLTLCSLLAWHVGYYPWQEGFQYAAAQWVRENTPPDAIIGSMNSGIIGYYGGRPTVNLDGVVNPQAFEATRRYDLLGFMQEAGIDYFVDVDYALSDEYGPFMGDGYERAFREIEPIGREFPFLGHIRAYEMDYEAVE